MGLAFVCRALYNAIGKSAAVSTVSKRCAPRARMAAGALVDAAVQWLGQAAEAETACERLYMGGR